MPRCHDNAESYKERRTMVRVQCARANKRWDKLTILCDSQKHITCLNIHCKACLKHFNSSIDQNQRNERDEDLLFVCLLLLSYAQAHRHLPHTITAMGMWEPPSMLKYAAENSHKHHQTLYIHAKKCPLANAPCRPSAVATPIPRKWKLSRVRMSSSLDHQLLVELASLCALHSLRIIVCTQTPKCEIQALSQEAFHRRRQTKYGHHDSE